MRRMVRRALSQVEGSVAAHAAAGPMLELLRARGQGARALRAEGRQAGEGLQPLSRRSSGSVSSPP
jgi:hypothetical protein